MRPPGEDRVTDERLTPAHIQSLGDELGGIFDEERLLRWASADVARSSFLKGAILGSITWSTSIGKPASATLWEAFDVQHEYCDETITAGKPLANCDDPAWWKSGDAPLGSDAQDGADKYRVIFVAYLTPLFLNRVTAGLRGDVAWQHPRPVEASPPVVVPAMQSFRSAGESVILEFAVTAPIRFDPTRPISQ
jgi:hypothetical protein